MRYDDASQAGSMANDHSPVARPDVDALPAGSMGPASGNAITGAGTSTGSSGEDTLGSPPAHIVAVEGAGGAATNVNGSFQATGQYGVLSIDAQGNFNYVRNGGTPDGVQDVFNYTLANADGQSSTTLTIDIGKGGTGQAAVIPGTAPVIPGVVNLPAGVQMSDIHVNGRDLVINMPDGTQMVIPNGAVFVPQLVIGDVQLPPTNLAALLIESEPQPAAGQTPSSGGNFATDVPPLDPGVPLGDLIPPTELNFPPPTIEIIGQIINHHPEAGAATAQLDDDALPGGNPGGVGDDPGTDNAFVAGNLPGSGGDAPIHWDLLNTGAPTGFTYVDGPNGSILVQQVQNGSTVTVLTITINAANGNYTVTENAPIMHPAGGDENNAVFVVNYNVVDVDGDTATGSLTITVNDDTPVVSNVQTGPGVTLDETTAGSPAGFPISATSVSPAISATLAFGADGANGPPIYALSLQGGVSTLASGLSTSIGDHPITLNLTSPTLITATYVDGSGTHTAFTVALNANGTITVTEYVPLEHGVASNPDTDETLSLAGLVNATVTITDKDGDSATGTAPIGGSIIFHDDGPSIHLADHGVANLVVDETDLSINASASFAANFTANFGGDGPAAGGGITYALGISGNGADSGLVDTASGNHVFLFVENGQVVGREGTDATAAAGGPEVFTVSVDSSGTVTLDQIRAVVQPTASDPDTDESVTLSAANLVTLTATATDSDGDFATQSLNIGTHLIFHDDGPSSSVNPEAALDTLVLDESRPIGSDVDGTAPAGLAVVTANFADNFNGPANFGADGPGTVSYSLVLNGSNVASGLYALDPSDTNSTDGDPTGRGAQILLNISGNTITGSAGGVDYFTISIDSSTGVVTFTQLNPIFHPDNGFVLLAADPGHDDDTASLMAAIGSVLVQQTVTDGDGDSAHSSVDVSQGVFQIQDSGPVAVSDSDTIGSGGTTATGNVMTGVGTDAGVAGADNVGADAPGHVIGLQSVAIPGNFQEVDPTVDIFGTGGIYTVHGLYGSLQMDSLGNYTYVRDAGSPGNVQDVFTYFITDADGDVTSATLTINIGNSIPTAGTITVQLDDDALAGGNPGGTGDVNPDTQNTSGTLPGSGGDGTLTFAFGSSSAPSGFTYDTSTPGTLLIKQGGITVVTVTLNSNGTYTVVQNAPVMHAPGADENNQQFTLHYTVTDADSDQATGTITINVNDDTPVVQVTNGLEPVLTVDETNFAVNATASFAANFSDSFGADGPAASNPSTWALSINAGATGLVDSLTGENVILVMNGGVVEGRTASSNLLVFTVSVDGSGNVTLDQSRAVIHSLGTDPDTSEGKTLAADNLVVLTHTITDKDGDPASASINIGTNLVFQDDGPVVSLTNTEATLTVDETNFAINDTKSFASSFSVNFGHDGPASSNSLVYTLGINAGSTGLVDSLTGENVILVLNGGVVEGRTASSNLLVFTVSVDSSGNVTLDQSRAVIHGTPSDPDTSEGKSLAADNLITLTATATDKDGDQSHQTINIGQNINFLDDGPTISTTGVEPTLTVDESFLAVNDTKSFAANFNINFGHDGPATSNSTVYTLGINAGATGLTDTLSGQSVILVNNGGVIEGRTSGSNLLVFTVSVDSSGNVTLDQIRAVVQGTPTNGDTSEGVTLAADSLITLTATVTDKDGDQAHATLNIGQNLNFLDDGPTAHINTTGQTISLDESVGVQVDSNDTTSASIIALFSGVANKGVDTDLPQYATNPLAIVNSTGTTLGADGGNVAFSLNVSASGVDSGLETTDGTHIFLFKEGNLIVGRPGANAGAAASNPAAFAIAIDSSTGAISMVEYLSIHNPDATNPDDSVSITNGAVLAVVTATDGDGDTSTASTAIGSLISFQDSAPVMVAADNINIQNDATPTFGGNFHYNLGADGAPTDNNVFKAMTGSATVNGTAVQNYTISETSENATTAVYSFTFDYPNGTGTTAHETGTLTFDKVAGTYTVSLDSPISGFSILATAGAPASAFINYDLNSSTTSNSPSEVATVKLADSFYLQFSGVYDKTGSDHQSTTSGDTTYLNGSSTTSSGGAFNTLDLFTQANATVTISSSAAGVAGNTIQGGEVLDFNLYTVDEQGFLGNTPNQSATSMFIELDGVGGSEDMIIILKLYDTVTHQYSTEALMVQNGDIIVQSTAGQLAGTPYAGITLDSNDGLIIIEPNDYQQGNSNLVIVGAQIAGSDDGIVGTAVNFNGTVGSSGGSSGTQAFSTDVSDAPFKIQNIGFLTQTTTDQTAHLTFTPTIQDGDGDSITQTITADVTSSANSATAISLSAAVTTVTPVVLDLNGDGVHFLSTDAGVHYDYGNGSVATAWASPQDGILAFDANHDGTVTNASEFVFGANGQTDLQALSAYDTNGDGKLDAGDAQFSSFVVWQDANSNGVADAGEVKSLMALGITSISLSSNGISYTTADGDVTVAGTGSYTTVNGTTGQLADASFATKTISTTSTTSSTDDLRSSSALASNAALIAAVAAAGLASQPLAAHTVTDVSNGSTGLDVATQHTEAFAPVALDAVGGTHGLDLASSIIGSGAHIAELPLNSHFQSSGISQTPGNFDSVGQLGAPSFSSLPQGTDAPAGGAGGSAGFTAEAVAMPNAALLMAAAHGGVAGPASSVGAQHDEVIGKVLADALHGGGSGPNVEALLNSLPQSGGHGQAAADALASHAAGAVPNGDMGVFAGFTGGLGLHMMQQHMVMHADAVPAHA